MVKEPPHPFLAWVLETLKELHRSPQGREALRAIARGYARDPEIVRRAKPWPEEVPFPLAALWASRPHLHFPNEDLVLALGLWHLSKGAYLFDPDVLAELLSTPLSRVPREVLRLPRRPSQEGLMPLVEGLGRQVVPLQGAVRLLLEPLAQARLLEAPPLLQTASPWTPRSTTGNPRCGASAT